MRPQKCSRSPPSPRSSRRRGMLVAGSRGPAGARRRGGASGLAIARRRTPAPAMQPRRPTRAGDSGDWARRAARPGAWADAGDGEREVPVSPEPREQPLHVPQPVRQRGRHGGVPAVEGRHGHVVGRQRLPARAAPERAGPRARLHRLRGHRLRDADRRLHERPEPVRQPLEVRAALGRRERPDELVHRGRRQRPRAQRQRRGDRRRRRHGVRAGDGRPPVGRAGLPRACRTRSTPLAQIQDIWKAEIQDGKLPKPGEWGGWNTVNISYFAPAYYRVFATLDPGDAWADRRRHGLRHDRLRRERGERQRRPTASSPPGATTAMARPARPRT